MRPSVILWALIASSILPVPVQGEIAPLDRATENRELVQRLVLDHAADLASRQRIADEREKQLFTELAAKDRKLRAEQKTRREAQADLAEVTSTLAAVTAERQHLVGEIAARDRRFAAEIGEFGRQVASLANSPDPRKREALKRYAEGDRVDAFDDLVSIQEELDKANDKASAAGWRELGALALDLKDRGEKDTNAAIGVFENAQKKDPDDAWGWIELRRLYQEAGRLPEARHAAEQALTHAQSDRERAVAESELGDLLFASGDLVLAYARFEKSNEIDERLAAANPTSETAQRDLSFSLEKLGDVLFASGEPLGARARFEKCLEIRERLATANPTSADAQHDVSVSLNKLGDLLVALGELPAAQARFKRGLEIDEQLVAANPTSANAQRDLSISLERLASVLVTLGDLPGARVRFEKCNEILEHLAAANPTSADAQRDLGVSLERLGSVLVASGDLPGARARFEKRLAIAERVAAVNPESADAQRDLIVSHLKLGSLPGGEFHQREALRVALDLQSQGHLAPSNAWIIVLLKQVADAEKAEP